MPLSRPRKVCYTRDEPFIQLLSANNSLVRNRIGYHIDGVTTMVPPAPRLLPIETPKPSKRPSMPQVIGLRLQVSTLNNATLYQPNPLLGPYHNLDPQSPNLLLLLYSSNHLLLAATPISPILLRISHRHPNDSHTATLSSDDAHLNY